MAKSAARLGESEGITAGAGEGVTKEFVTASIFGTYASPVGGAESGFERFGGPYLAGAEFTAVDAFFAPVVFRVQTYGLALGAGEVTAGPTAAVIANAIADATGLRLRRLPFTPEAIRAAAMEET